MTTDPIVALERIRTGLTTAYPNIYNRIPSNAPDAERTNRTNGNTAPAPTIDEEIAGRYRAAQTALRVVYDQLAAAGAPRFWAGNGNPTAIVHESRLALVVNEMVVHAELLDAASVDQLAAAAKRLAPFWQPAEERRLPGGCVNCHKDHSRRGPLCGPCYAWQRRNEGRPRPQSRWADA